MAKKASKRRKLPARTVNKGGRPKKVTRKVTNKAKENGWRFVHDGRNWTVEKLVRDKESKQLRWQPQNVYFTQVVGAASWVREQLLGAGRQPTTCNQLIAAIKESNNLIDAVVRECTE